MSGYDFSPLYHSSILAFSPGTTFIATAHLNRIIVRSTSTLAIVRTWLCLPSSPIASSSRTPEADLAGSFSVDQLEWSDDGMFILANSTKAATAWVFGLVEEGNGESGEMARLGGEGIDGMVRVEWARGGREVLVWSDHNLRLVVHSLADGSTAMIRNPKSHIGCHTYSSDGRYFAIAERHSAKEHVGVYDVFDGFKLVRHFPLQTTDIQGLCWSPCGKWFAAWDSPLAYSMFVHSPIGSEVIHFTPSSPAFSSLASSEDPGVGIRLVQWAPGGRFVAIGGWDGKVRILESDGWRSVAVISLEGKSVGKGVTLWREPHEWLRDTRGRGIVQCAVPIVRPDYACDPPRVGISHLSFSPPGSHLLVRLATAPNLVHIYTFLPSPTASAPVIAHVAALVFTQTVRDATWAPKGSRLAIVTRSGGDRRDEIGENGGAAYFWDAEGWVEEGEDGEKGGSVEGVGIPCRGNFIPYGLTWSPDGSTLALRDKGQFCLLYEPDKGGVSRRPISRGADDAGWVEGLTHIAEGEEDEEGGANVSRHGLGMARQMIRVAG